MARNRRLKKTEDSTDINISPMIDMVFILLIFFIVTTVFVDEQGLQVDRPRPSTEPQNQDEKPFKLHISEQGEIMLNDGNIGIGGVRGRVESRLAEKGAETPINLQVHPDVRSSLMVQVLDEIKLGGAQVISVQQSN